MKRSRAYRKFMRNKLAVAAAVVIAIYATIALVVMLPFGPLSLEDTTARVGPSHLPGFGMTPSPAKRAEIIEYYANLVARALNRVDAKVALGEVRVGRQRIVDRPLDELAADVARIDQLLDEVTRDDDFARNAALLPKIDEADRLARSLYAPLTGWDGVAQKAALVFGTDRQGRSIAARGFYAAKVAFQIGLVTAIFSVLFGSFLGAAAAFFGGWVDHLVIWLYSTLSSIPHLVLLGVLVFMFSGKPLEQTLVPVYVAFCLTFWIGPCRVVRGEALRIKELDYVQAANALGQSRMTILMRHILPNVAHLMFVNFSLLFIGAIKSEVILTFLGLGVKSEPSWGIMIQQSSSEIVNEFFWQIGAATALMFFLVLAFNIFTDALQDALDPKHIG